MVKATSSYFIHKRGLAFDARFELGGGEKYTYKKNRFSSHKQILDIVGVNENSAQPSILDVGCASGELAARISARGFKVYGVDIYDNPEASKHW